MRIFWLLLASLKYWPRAVFEWILVIAFYALWFLYRILR